MILHSFFGALLLGSSFAFPSGSSDGSDQDAWGPYQVFEKQALVPKGWTYSGPAVNSTELHLQLYLKSNPEHDLSSKILQISTPGHADYGQHLNSEALAQYISPSVDSIEFVMSWLSSFVDVSSIVYSSESGYLSFDTTVWSASQIFDAKFSTYQNLAGDKVITRTLEYSLPESVLSHVALVHPMAYFPRPKTVQGITPEVAPRHIPANLGLSKRAANLTEILAACSGIYPICISTLYNISYVPPTDSQSGSALGIAGFLEQYVNITDVNSFVRKYGTSESTRANPGNISIEIVNGGINNASFPGVEATLDLEYTTPFTGSLPVTYYSTGGRPPQLDDSGNLLPSDESDSEPYLEWLEYMLAKPDGEIPQVISISYSDTEQTVPRAYALHVCDLFGRLTARGVSILDASGDGGVAGTSFDDTCVSNDGLNHTQFQPTFPASCPWVTGVGSTSYIPEQGSDFSAGGFSNYFPTPDYQINATASYIKYLDGQYEGLYNASGRGIPDVAAYGSRYETENNNSSSYHHSGASASTPVFASMIALINDYRLRQGKTVLGFLNPLLYSHGVEGVWNDITEGYSYGCSLTWNATVGWDTLTGLGSPDFGRLMDALA